MIARQTVAAVLLALVSILGLPPAARACPDCDSFSLQDYLKQAGLVTELEFTKVDANTGIGTAAVKRVFKCDANQAGISAPKEIKVDFLAMGEALNAQGKEMLKRLQEGPTQAVLFAGVFDVSDGDPAEDQAIRGFLHVGGKWVVLTREPKSGVWEMDKIWEFLLAAFPGSTDQLVRCIDYSQANPDVRIPSRTESAWDKPVKLGHVEGKVSAAEAVSPAGGGRVELYLACEKGDRLFRFDGNAEPNAAPVRELSARSVAHAWGDFDGDGWLDLASWDGRKLRVLFQSEPGKFSAVNCRIDGASWSDAPSRQPGPSMAASQTTLAMAPGITRLATLDASRPKRTAMVASTGGWPVLLMPHLGGAVDRKALGEGNFPIWEVGEAGPCLVEDFDGDGTPDVFQVCASGALFYKGKGGGEFAAPVAALPPLYEGTSFRGPTNPRAVCAGDFDQDGLLDVFAASEHGCRLWQNLGGGKFRERVDLSGEVAYIPKGGGVAVAAGDFNNDGWQDLIVAYEIPVEAHIFQNQGFRCFEQDRGLELVESPGANQPRKDRIPGVSEGQQAACLGDFDGDGALEMALVLKNGDVWLLPRQVNKDLPAAGVAVALPLPAPLAGPVNVQAWHNKNFLGVWPVRAGAPATILGARGGTGEITLKWTLPGGKTKEKKVAVKERVVPVRLDAE